MQYHFAENAWTMEGLVPAYSARFTATPMFVQKKDYIENPAESTNDDGYSYISLVTKEKVKPGVKLTTHCSFQGTAAPLIVMAKDLYEEDGVLRYKDYQEVVIYKNGLNVWDLWGQKDGTVKWHKLLGITKALEENVIYALEIRIADNRFYIRLEDVEVELLVPDSYPEFHLGITGCEGVCRFYDMTIEE